jgi:hypothetical protein
MLCCMPALWGNQRHHAMGSLLLLLVYAWRTVCQVVLNTLLDHQPEGLLLFHPLRVSLAVQAMAPHNEPTLHASAASALPRLPRRARGPQHHPASPGG